MPYDVPGRSDAANQDVIDAWNQEIQDNFARLEPDFGTRFFSIDPDAIANATPTATVKWFADPVEPVSCLNRQAAQELSDWDVRGRHRLHNEYAEYRIIRQQDPASGRLRPKRVEVTTELREYWVCVARIDPAAVRAMAKEVLGSEPSFEDLFGVADPEALTPAEREIAFSRTVAGNGGDRQLEAQGVPSQPTGTLNTERALFMSHPINGLDDLIYIVMFGAKPYARVVGGQLRPATRNQIFRAFGVEHLACRHADPAAAIGAHTQVFNGRPVGFANPLGVYMINFAREVFSLRGAALPDDWVQFSRGQNGLFQRLEFGPPDDAAEFLDDIEVEVGGQPQVVTGGYQVLQRLEVGPVVLVGAAPPVQDDEFVVLATSAAAIDCRQAGVCPSIQALKNEFDASQPQVRLGPRRMGPGA